MRPGCSDLVSGEVPSVSCITELVDEIATTAGPGGVPNCCGVNAVPTPGTSKFWTVASNSLRSSGSTKNANLRAEEAATRSPC